MERMEQAEQAVPFALEANFPDELSIPQSATMPAVTNDYASVIRELDAIFDLIHGGRRARYSGVRLSDSM